MLLSAKTSGPGTLVVAAVARRDEVPRVVAAKWRLWLRTDIAHAVPPGAGLRLLAGAREAGHQRVRVRALNEDGEVNAEVERLER